MAYNCHQAGGEARQGQGWKCYSDLVPVVQVVVEAFLSARLWAATRGSS